MPSSKNNLEPQTDKFPHVDTFNELVNTALFEQPEIMAGYAKARPEVCFGFGETTESSLYIFFTFEKSSALSRDIPWINGPFTSDKFMFSIDEDGCLIRRIDLSYKTTDGPCERKLIETNLGPEMGADFTEYLLKLLEKLQEVPFEEMCEEKERILDSMRGLSDFCQVDNRQTDIITTLHDDLMKTKIVTKAEEPSGTL